VRGRVAVDVAAQTAGVVAESVGLGVGRDRKGEAGQDGAEVDGHVAEGAGGDAAAAGAGREGVEGGRGDGEGDSVVGDGCSVAGHGVLGGVGVEKGRVFGVGRPAPPVPVGLGTEVAAFGAQGLLVVPDVVAVPGEEEGRHVVARGLLDVHDRVVIEAGFGAGRKG